MSPGGRILRAPSSPHLALVPMNDKPTPLAQRLAAYSAAAGVTHAVVSDAGAQIVYFDIDPDEVVTVGDTFNLDFYEAGTIDFTFVGNTGGGPGTTARF